MMNKDYDEWENDSPRWRDELDRALRKQNGTDVVTDYKSVALAFPSPKPHASTFDYPRIDDSALRKWAAERGWKVRTAPESGSGYDPCSPPIRFTKNSPN